MTVANYINDLLYRYDCVIVPNFGGFITNRISAKVDNSTDTFYPPSKQISFNNHLKHNDGLLANHIASSENISFEKATQKIGTTVANWNKELAVSSIKLTNLGTFSLNAEKQLIFEPSTKTNYLTESFGLATFESAAIKRFKQQVKPLVVVKEENKKGIPVFIKYAATAAILLTLGFTGWNGYQKNQQKEVFAKQQKQLEEKIQTATFVISNPLPTINLQVVTTAKNFHVVAGAFRIPENADKKVAQLIKKGFDAQILGKNKWGLTEVVFASFADRNDAINNLRKIQRTVSKDAWLLIKK